MTRAAPALPIALAAALAVPALADDTGDSSVVVTTDTEEAFAADAFLVFEDTTAPDGINSEIGWLFPPTHLEVFDDDPNWEFYLAVLVEGWVIPYTSDYDGAYNVRLGLWGEHLAHPHEDGPNWLPLVLSGQAPDVQFSVPDVHFVQHSRRVSVAGCEYHEEHMDWYSAKHDCHAYSAWAPGVPATWGVGEVHARHTGAPGEDDDPRSDHDTMGSTPTQGSHAAFDPASGTLLVQMGGVDILDRDGGRSGGIDPALAGDPLAGATPTPVILQFAGFDAERGEYVFVGGELGVSHADAPVAIDGVIGELRIRSTMPGETLGNYAWFRSLTVADSGEPEGASSEWAERFVDTGWHGEELSPSEQAALVYPVLTLTTDIDLVEATQGFTQAAELPATVLLTILTAHFACPADLNGDHELDFDDVILFLVAFAEGDPSADLVPDGVLDFSDVVAFLASFGSGCH